MCGRETGMRPRRHDARDKDVWKGFWKDQVKSLEHKHPVFGTCRQLDHSAISELVVVMVFWIGPSLLGLVLALLFRSSGRIRRDLVDLMGDYFFVLGVITVASAFFFVGRYLGARWALQSVCAVTTGHYIDGRPGPTFH